MKSRITTQFRQGFADLPEQVQEQTREAYRLFKQDPSHPPGKEFQRLKKAYPRLGTMDLKIAAIALVNQAILLTHNSSNFGQIAGLRTEDWT